jgi:hypothetical protein
MLFLIILIQIAIVSNIAVVDAFRTAFPPRRAFLVDNAHHSPSTSFSIQKRRFSRQSIVTHTASLLPAPDLDTKQHENEADADAVNVVLVTGFESFNR